MHSDYFLKEFFDILDETVHSWIKSVIDFCFIGDIDVSSALESYVNYSNYYNRDAYIQLRCNGLSSSEAISSLLRVPNPFEQTDITDLKLKEAPVTDEISKWRELLLPLHHQPVYYANFQRMVDYIMPFIFREKSDAILITDGDIDLSQYDLPEHISVVRFFDPHIRMYRNPFLERNFPVFFSYANAILFLDKVIEPPIFQCICGCQTQSKLWATVCNARGGESICFQHGWPAFLHAGFKRLPYKHMALWGAEFIKLWTKDNPDMNFFITGYPYPVEVNGTHNCVTFFLQEPYFISSKNMVDCMFELITQTARNNPDLTIQYRIHPESSISRDTKNILDTHSNVKDVSDDSLSEVYASTRVAVSHYSSTIMESIIHGCCPLVFNLTPNWNYNPNLEKEGIGFISTSVESFQSKLKSALSFYISKQKVSEWYAKFPPLPTA